MQHRLYFFPLPHGQGSFRDGVVINSSYGRAQSADRDMPKLAKRLFEFLVELSRCGDRPSVVRGRRGAPRHL